MAWGTHAAEVQLNCSRIPEYRLEPLACSHVWFGVMLRGYAYSRTNCAGRGWLPYHSVEGAVVARQGAELASGTDGNAAAGADGNARAARCLTAAAGEVR